MASYYYAYRSATNSFPAVRGQPSRVDRATTRKRAPKTTNVKTAYAAEPPLRVKAVKRATESDAL